uniref:Alpha kinase 1 n=1 Tax=Leptobrachium leishanense TaxID=445787 RepID=A0A8C5LYP3_9ANUR
MNNQEVVAVLEECKQKLESLASEVSKPSEEEKNDHQRCKDSLPEDLTNLIQEAKEMKWPFVPERWQYKQAISPEDKTNLQDIINPRLHDLLVYLKASITVADSATAAAVVFLIDRFLYWADASTRLLRVAKALHELWPHTPLAPQVVIRQARISANSGKLLKAEYILSSLIINKGATGSWRYADENDRVLVQSVCVQIRGEILQKLGLWYEAAELIWASIVGFSELPIPDKKGIAKSLGDLADIFISMNEDDYQRFKSSNQVCLSILEEYDHRLLSAAEACKLGATFSLYNPLFVLTNVNIRGTCLLSYSLSNKCTKEKRSHYLSAAKEAFEIGLLTKKKGDLVPSKQELHSLVKSAYSLANVHKWLQGDSARDKEVSLLCKEAMEKLAKYSELKDKQDKGNLAKDIMTQVDTIKELLKVEAFPNSDDRSYVPDSYRDCAKKTILNGKVRFIDILTRFSHHHKSVCDIFETSCRKQDSREVMSGACVTSLKTVDTVSTIEDISSPTNSVPSSQHHKNRRERFARSNALKDSVGDEQQPSLNRAYNSQVSLTGSLKSWSKVSNSSSSWESFNFNNEAGEIKDSITDQTKMHSRSTEAFDALEENDPRVSNDSDDDMSFEHLSLQEEDGSQINPQDAQNDSHVTKDSVPTDVLDTTVYGSTDQNQHTNVSLCELVDPNAETECTTDVTTQPTAVSQNENSMMTNLVGKMLSLGIDPEGETIDTTDDIPFGNCEPSTTSASNQNKIKLQQSASGSKGRDYDVDIGEKLDEFSSLKQQWSVDSSSSRHFLQQQKSTGSLNSASSVVNADYVCESTEEEVDKLKLSFSSSHGSSYWTKSAQFSSSLSDSNSFLNSSGSSFVFLNLNNSKEIHPLPTLKSVEYENLISGVNNDWLLQKLEGTEKITSIPLNNVYNALLLKFSKKSELWTAQETYVYFGDYVKVSKQGQQRNAFWIHCLHQDETLGRYVGKEYKKPRSILYHFSDVERQMTAQYYVTEFNKRLYEMNIPTQLFYIPSYVLLILEDHTIKGCISVEPYVLGDFVKLSNNKEVVKTQYEATKYGLALGHFAYEFSGCSDIVVDLQGWVTGSAKGEALIYLTDPQIHSIKDSSADSDSNREATCTNFGKRGIKYFFSKQHTKCNEICHSLSLTRPILSDL